MKLNEIIHSNLSTGHTDTGENVNIREVLHLKVSAFVQVGAVVLRDVWIKPIVVSDRKNISDEFSE